MAAGNKQPHDCTDQHTIVRKNLETAAVGVCSTVAGMLAIIMDTTSKSKLLPTYQAHNATRDTNPAQLTDSFIMKCRNTSSKELSSEINTEMELPETTIS